MITELKPRFQKKGGDSKNLEDKLFKNFNSAKNPLSDAQALENKIKQLKEGMKKSDNQTSSNVVHTEENINQNSSMGKSIEQQPFSLDLGRKEQNNSINIQRKDEIQPIIGNVKIEEIKSFDSEDLLSSKQKSQQHSVSISKASSINSKNEAKKVIEQKESKTESKRESVNIGSQNISDDQKTQDNRPFQFIRNQVKFPIIVEDLKKSTVSSAENTIQKKKSSRIPSVEHSMLSIAQQSNKSLNRINMNHNHSISEKSQESLFMDDTKLHDINNTDENSKLKVAKKANAEILLSSNIVNTSSEDAEFIVDENDFLEEPSLSMEKVQFVNGIIKPYLGNQLESQDTERNILDKLSKDQNQMNIVLTKYMSTKIELPVIDQQDGDNEDSIKTITSQSLKEEFKDKNNDIGIKVLSGNDNDDDGVRFVVTFQNRESMNADNTISPINRQLQTQSTFEQNPFQQSPDRSIIKLDLKAVNSPSLVTEQEEGKIDETLQEKQEELKLTDEIKESEAKNQEGEEEKKQDQANNSLIVSEQLERLESRIKTDNEDENKKKLSQKEESKHDSQQSPLLPYFSQTTKKTTAGKQTLKGAFSKTMKTMANKIIRTKKHELGYQEFVISNGYFVNLLSEINYQLQKQNLNNEEQIHKMQNRFMLQASKILKYKELYKMIFDFFNHRQELVLFVSAFSIEEIHQMFMKFYQQFDMDESLTFEYEEIMNMIEIFVEKMGKEKMKQLLHHAGVNFESGLKTLFKEGGFKDTTFPHEVYQRFFEILAHDGEDFIHFNNLLPYLMIFFLYSQHQAIKDRKKLFEEVLGEQPQYKSGLFKSFIKYGMKAEDAKKKVITYRTVEKVVVELRSLYQSAFGFDQIELILRQVRIRMNVDPISKVEKEKISYKDETGGLCFSRWLALLICQQMTWTRLKKQLKGQRFPFVYLYEERLWHLAAIIDDFIPEHINQLVEEKYHARIQKFMDDRNQKKADEESVLQTELDESLHTIITDKIANSINIKSYMECTYEVLKHFNPWITITFVKEAVFFFLQRIIFLTNNNQEKANKLIEYVFGPEDSTNVQTKQRKRFQQLNYQRIHRVITEYNQVQEYQYQLYEPIQTHFQNPKCTCQALSSITFIQPGKQNYTFQYQFQLSKDKINDLTESFRLVVETDFHLAGGLTMDEKDRKVLDSEHNNEDKNKDDSRYNSASRRLAIFNKHSSELLVAGEDKDKQDYSGPLQRKKAMNNISSAGTSKQVTKRTGDFAQGAAESNMKTQLSKQITSAKRVGNFRGRKNYTKKSTKEDRLASQEKTLQSGEEEEEDEEELGRTKALIDEQVNEDFKLRDKLDLVNFLLTCKKVNNVMEEEDEARLAALYNNGKKQKDIEKQIKNQKSKKFIKKELTLCEDQSTKINFDKALNKHVINQQKREQKQQNLLKQQTQKVLDDIKQKNYRQDIDRHYMREIDIKKGFAQKEAQEGVLGPPKIDDQKYKMLKYGKADDDEEYLDFLRYENKMYLQEQALRNSKNNRQDCQCRIF